MSENQGFFYSEWQGEPCPFCGSAGISGKNREGFVFAGCDDPDCIAHQLTFDFVTVDHARAAWNTRGGKQAAPPFVSGSSQ